MKKESFLRPLLVIALLVTLSLTVYSLDGEYEGISTFDFQTETKTNLTTVERQVVSAPSFGGDFSLYDNKQEAVFYTVTGDNGLQLDFIQLNIELTINNIGGLRGEFLLSAEFV